MRRGIALVLACAAAAACADESVDSIQRGDRLLVRGDSEAALAEYRLALRQRGEEPEVLLRLAHAFAARGDVEGAARHYRRLVARDSSLRFQAAADLSELAEEARRRGEEGRMVRALRPVVEWGIDLVPADLRRAMGLHLAGEGEYAEALPLLLSVHGEADLSSLPPRVVYETGRAYEELGGCRKALIYFEAYREMAGPAEGPEREGARWHYGSCLYAVAREEWRAGRGEAALTRLDRLVELGVPRTLIDRAQYLRGELLLARGDREGALAAFREVLRLNPARSAPVAHMAEERVREIRYGEGGNGE